MKFCWSTLRVVHLEESLRFYQEIIGLPLGQRFTTGDGRNIAFLGAGETKLELIEDPKKKEVHIGQDISLGFQVESLDDKIVFLQEQGIPLHAGPFQPSPSIRFIYILDPNGLKIQLVEQQ